MMCQNVCFFRLPEKKTSRPVSTKNKQKETMKSRTYWSGFKMTKCLQPLFMDIIRRRVKGAVSRQSSSFSLICQSLTLNRYGN